MPHPPHTQPRLCVGLVSLTLRRRYSTGVVPSDLILTRLRYLP